MEHKDAILARELDILRDRLLLMGGEAELALQRAINALVHRDSDLAQQVLEHDKTIDDMEVEIDRLSMDILALRRPAARDLRAVISISKITPVLERIADHAANIARVAVELNDEPEVKTFGELPVMAEKASEMLREALDAFTSNDAESARGIKARDAEINEIYERQFKEFMESMSQEAEYSTRLARLLFITKHLERIGDYVKDICEVTVYMKEAVSIKHLKNHAA
ncbi:MAG TPA: phosphate signaling complex protein PhoU [Pyrinomonadaceae bacterium]|jgi:phosphate transport system protein|nr:phosphate signaling complex protein PhoU [Pyrinomonadaceae bacterium]